MRSPQLSAPAIRSDVDRVPPGVVQARGLSVRYGDHQALSDVDLEIAPGEVTVLLGHSGSGKSTLLKALIGMVPTEADRLLVCGQDLPAADPGRLRAVRSRVGHIFQHFNLVPQLSALTNVLTGGLYSAGRANLLGLFTTAQRRRALELLDRVGLEAKARQQSRSLSGGEQQRVAIARALMQQPQLILADEPVASLDPRLAGTVLRLLSEIAEERGIAVIISLHVLALARRYGDRVIGLHAGRLVFDGPAADLDQAAVRAIYGADDEYGD